jgi:DNA helicase-2/ATP-dependent DNA helicase PcrA
MTQGIAEAKRRASTPTNPRPNSHEQDWTVGDRIVHKAFGVGQVTHIFGKADKICLAIKFPGLGQKIIDPKITVLQRVE